MQTIKTTTSQNIDIDHAIAGLGKRILARLIDITILSVIFLFISSLYLLYFGVVVTLHPLLGDESTIYFMGTVSCILGAVILIFYNVVAEVFFNGQSIGKRIAKIKVVSIDGLRPTIGQYLIRWVFSLIDFGATFGLGAIIAVAASAQKQRIGDLVAGTILVKTTPPQSIK